MSYKAGIIAAITELKDRSGSSMIAIKKAMQEKLPKEKKWMNATFLSTLKKGVADGEFVQIKNSYKLSADFKKALAKKAAPKKVAPKKKAAPKKADGAKKTASKKVCN
jgi:linker histone H1 and H5 family.